jgi:hypothetical protein
MVSKAKESVVTMDEAALRQLSRAQIQQLARVSITSNEALVFDQLMSYYYLAK